MNKYRELLEFLWATKWRGVVFGGGAAILAGVLIGLTMPRGPISSSEGLLLMATGAGVGLLAGLAMGSRWSLLLAPVAFTFAVEFVRIPHSGPTVDAPVLSTYGLIALFTFRGFSALLTFGPMLVGAVLGAGAARRIRSEAVGGRSRAGAGLRVRRAFSAIAVTMMILLALQVARSGSTDPITTPGGEPVPGSIAELIKIDVNGSRLGLMLRSADRRKPVLLYLAGGPGGTEYGAMRRHLSTLERDFVVATWDQRGAGTSYGALEPVAKLTPETMVDDTLAVTDYLRARFRQERIYLVGQSWGSLLGVMAVHRSPERFKAFVGTGQIVNVRETDKIMYRDALEWARKNGRSSDVERLEQIGAPPYRNVLDYETAFAFEHQVSPYDHSVNSEGAGGFSENVFVKEYSLIEQVHNVGAFIDTFSFVYPRIQTIDLRRSAQRLEVPVTLIQGRHEARGRNVLAEQWFHELEAPAKQWITLETSGHRPLFEQPEEFTRVMRERVLLNRG